MSNHAQLRTPPTQVQLAVRAIVILLVTVMMSVSVASMALTNNQQAGQIVTLSENNDALRDQVKQSGETPVAPPASSVVDGKNGADGVAGARGLNGFDGKDGKDGESIIGETGAAGADGESITGPTGASGESIVGPTGDTGGTGSDGAAGGTGATGATGPGGEPVYGWTQPGRTPGSTETCARAEPFDPATPTYTCTETVTPE